jgi:hypothetical protein
LSTQGETFREENGKKGVGINMVASKGERFGCLKRLVGKKMGGRIGKDMPMMGRRR